MTEAAGLLDEVSRQVDAVERWLENGTGRVPPKLAELSLARLSQNELATATALRERIDSCVERMSKARDEVSSELESFGQRRSVARQYLEQGRRP